MKENKKRIGNIYLKAGLWAMVAEVLVRSISFLSTPVFSRILPMDVYGEAQTFESWMTIWIPVLSLSLYSNIEVAQYRFKEQFKQYVSSVIFLIVSIYFIVFCAALLLRTQLANLLGFTTSTLLVAVIYCCTQSCFLCLLRAQRILLKYKSAALLSAVSTVPAILISVVCCLLSQNLSHTSLYEVRVISFYLPLILVGAVSAGIFVLRNKTMIRMEYWTYALKISAPLVMYQVSLQVLTQSDRIMIKYMDGPAKAALYSLSTTVIYIVEVLNRALESAWIPWLYRQLDTKQYQQVKKAIFMILGGFAVLFVYLILLGPEIIFILGGKNYGEAIWLLGPMLASVTFQFFMLKLADIGKFYQKNNYIAIISIIVSFLNLGLNYVGIQMWGYQAAAYTTMFSYIVAVLIYLGLMRAKIPQLKLCYGKMFALCSGIAALMVALMSFFALPHWLRYLAVVVLTTLLFSILFHFRENLKKIWRQNNAQ